MLAFINGSATDDIKEVPELILDASIYASAQSIPIANLTGAAVDNIATIAPFFMLQNEFTASQLEEYLLSNAPQLGAVSLFEWFSNSTTYSITYNDTEIHSLPILVNLFNNLIYNQQHDGIISATISPLGARSIIFHLQNFFHV